MLRAVVVLVFSMLWAQNVFAHAWVVNNPIWSRSYARAVVPGAQQTTDSGVVFGQSTATAAAANANANAFAHANSIGRWGGTALATAAGAGAWAGDEQPFNTPIVPTTGFGNANIAFDAGRDGERFNLTGTAGNNEGGYLELAVLNVSGLSEDYVSGIFLTYGSVESALTAGYIDNSRVLFSARETTLDPSFSYEVMTGDLLDEELVISAVAHAAAVPEPSTLALLGLGGAGMLASRWRAKRRDRV